MSADVTGYLSAADGISDQDGVFQVEGLYEGREVVGIGVHIVAARGLARAPMASAVVVDRAVAV